MVKILMCPVLTACTGTILNVGPLRMSWRSVRPLKRSSTMVRLFALVLVLARCRRCVVRLKVRLVVLWRALGCRFCCLGPRLFGRRGVVVWRCKARLRPRARPRSVVRLKWRNENSVHGDINLLLSLPERVLSGRWTLGAHQRSRIPNHSSKTAVAVARGSAPVGRIGVLTKI